MTNLQPRTAGPSARTDHGRVIVELTSRLVSAEALLASLQKAQESSARLLGQERRVDLVKRLTGQSSFDAAIASTGEMICELRQAVSSARRAKALERFAPVGVNS
ncbi:MAG: hypothetical protein KDA20_10320 [Phycisphaerales bacterium]|nr:hypothetical protein [Phycisphaerales bacterium]